MTPHDTLMALESAAYNAYHENTVPVDAAMASHVFADGHVVTVCYSPEEGYDYSYSDTAGGLRGPYVTRDLCLFDVEARMGVAAHA